MVLDLYIEEDVGTAWTTARYLRTDLESVRARVPKYEKVHVALPKCNDLFPMFGGLNNPAIAANMGPCYFPTLRKGQFAETSDPSPISEV